MHNNQLDKFIETLIEEMSTKQLWKLVFNKMTNAAKRQMLGEMLNTLMGSGYSTNGNMFDYNPKEIMKTSGEAIDKAIDKASKPFTDEGYVDFTQKVIYKPWKNIDENMHKENEEDLSKEQDKFLIKANEVINKANKLLAALEEIKELNTKALIKNRIEILFSMQLIIIRCIKEVEGQYYSKAVEEVFLSMVEQLGRAIKEEQNKLEGNNNETTIEEN